MSKKKINAADLVDMLALELGLTKKLSDDFIKALTETIEDALLEQDSVRIHGLGTFKTQWNNPRKSVDVNTGEDILIDGFYKLVFTPENTLKDLANEPYEHLESVVLEEEDMEEDDNLINSDEKNEVDNDMPTDRKSKGNNADPVLAPLRHLDEQASEIKDLLSEINALREPKEEKVDVVEATSMSPVADEDEDVSDVEADAEENDYSPADEDVEDIENIDAEATSVLPIADAAGDADLPEEPSSPKTKPTESQNAITKTWKFIYTFLIIALIAVLIGVLVQKGAISYLKEFFEDTFKSHQVALVQVQDESLIDELSKNEDIADIEEATELPTQIVDETDDNTDLSAVLAIEKVRQGSRLAQIAFRHYGVREFWVYIYEANRDKLNTPDDLAVGMELIIPVLSPEIGDRNNPECIEIAKKLQDKYINR